MIPNNFTEELWSKLKAWAKGHADAGASPTREESVAAVRSFCQQLTGHADFLACDVVAFYAAEMLEMLTKFRAMPGR